MPYSDQPQPPASTVIPEVMARLPLAAMILATTDGEIRQLNRKFVELFGYTADDLRHLSQWWPLAYPDLEARQRAQAQWAAWTLQVESRDGTVEPQDVTVTCQDGTKRYLRAELAKLGGAYLLTFIDLTAQHRTEEALTFLATCGSSPGEDFFRSLSGFLASQLDVDFVCIDLLEGDGLNARTLAMWCDGCFEDNVTYALKDTPCGVVVGETVCCFPAGVAAAFPNDSVLQDLHAESYVGVTLWDHTGKPIGLIAAIGRRPLADRKLAEAMLKLVAGRAAGELERQQAEEALKASEARYRTQFNLASEGISTHSLQGELLEVNEALARLHGYTREEMQGLNLRHLDTPTSYALAAERMDRLLAGEALTFELEHLHQDGHAIPLEVSASIIDDGGQRVILAFQRDISERRRTEEAIREGEKRLAVILDSLTSCIFIKNLEGRYTYVNRMVCDLFGLPAEAIIGKGDAAFFLGESLAEIERSDAPVLQRGETMVREEVLRSASDGKERVFSTVKIPLRDATGAIYGLCGNSTDITDRMAIEGALRESEERLRVIFEASEAGIILVSPRGEIRFANRRMAEMLGRNVSELIGTRYPAHLHGTQKAIGDERMRQLISGEIHSVSLERRYLRADGSTFWGHLSGRRMGNPDGSLRALVGIITDVSLRREAEEQQRLLQAQLHQAQKMESLGSLAGGVAHDMNNVLGAILGLASAHIEAQPPGSPAQNAFGTIIKAAERGGNMLKGLLSFARQNSAEEQDLDLNTILREEVRLLEHTTLSKVKLVMDLTPGLRPIRGDAGALTNAFMNLCVNAVDAMPAGRTLTLRTRNLGLDWIEVQVQDTGTGMVQEVLGKALDPFFTTKEVGKGTGLGLSIVYSTVKACLGEMELTSRPGEGTCIILRFPAGLEPAVPAEPSGAYQTMPRQGALKVLLVDDDELIQSSMEGMLELLGHQPTCARSGEEALALLEGGLRSDVVILDMNMPGLGGIGTLPRLRILQPRLPVLLATGRADQAAQDLVQAFPFVTLLSKPFGMKELQAHLAPFA